MIKLDTKLHVRWVIYARLHTGDGGPAIAKRIGEVVASSPLSALDFGQTMVAKMKFPEPLAGVEVRHPDDEPLEKLVKERREARKKQGGSWCYIKRGRPSKKEREAREQRSFEDFEAEEN